MKQAEKRFNIYSYHSPHSNDRSLLVLGYQQVSKNGLG
jgi:hypothetical protein